MAGKIPPPFRQRFVRRDESRRWLMLLCGLVLDHVLLSMVLPAAGWVTSLGVGAVCLLAMALCLRCSAGSGPRLRWRWWLLAFAFLLWAGAYAAIGYLQCVTHADSSNVQVDELLYMLRGIPFLLLLSPIDSIDEAPALRWIDGAQALLFAALAVVLLFPNAVHDGASSVPLVSDRTALTYHDVQNFTLAFLSIAAMASRYSVTSYRFSQAVCSLLTTYAVVSWLVNHLVIAPFSPPPGSPINLASDVPLVVFILLVLEPPADRAFPSAPRRRQLFIKFAMATTFCIASVLASFAIAQHFRWLGLAGAILAILLSTARTALIQLRLMDARAALSRTNDRLASLATSDALTGLANRRAFDDRLRAEWNGTARASARLAVLLIDVDGFKLFNDTNGHRAGDECLRRVANAMRTATLRESDLLARYGGEEFALIARVNDAAGARIAAERLRTAVEDLAIPHSAMPHGVVTVSIGLAVNIPYVDSHAIGDLVEQADVALYRAKQNGRNRVETIPPA